MFWELKHTDTYLKDLPKEGPFIALSSGILEFEDGRQISLTGRGIDPDPELAFVKSRSELMERISAYLPPREPIVWGSAGDFTEACLLPRFAGRAAGRWWVRVHAFASEETAFIPLEFAQLASQGTIRDPLVKASSAGMAAHPDLAAAIANAKHELAERLALGRLFNGAAAMLICEESLPAPTLQYTMLIRRMGYEVFLVPAGHSDGAHTVAALLYSQGSPSLLTGAAAAQSVADAAHSALMEAYAQLVVVLERAHDLPGSPDGMAWYYKKENARKLLDSLGVGAAQPLPLTEIQEARSSGKNLENYWWLDRGNSEADRHGIRVVQVIHPDYDHAFNSPFPDPFS